MARDRKACCLGSKEEETMLILFGQELENFSCDGFDGSKEDRHIFADIFYGGSLKDENNSCAVSGTSNYVRDAFGGCGRKANINSNLENSYISSISSMKGSSGEVLELSKVMYPKDSTPSGYVLQSSTSWVGSSAGKLNSKKSSSPYTGFLDQGSKEHCCNYPVKKSKLLKSDSQCHQPFSLRIVESFAHGILSSYYSVQLGSMDVASDIVDRGTLNYGSLVRPIGENKIGLEDNFVTSPVSQESIASGLLKGGSTFEDKKNSEVGACMNQITLETIKRHPTTYEIIKRNPTSLETIKRHPSGGRSKRITNKEMPGLLESYAHSLLVDAGWIIDIRVRKERNKMSYLFKNPDDGLVCSTLTGAWKICGERLLLRESDGEDPGREWSDVDEFWGDLKGIFAYIDMETRQQEGKLSLLRRWQLLDPFLAVVFINRKISFLRMGKLVRAVRSSTYILDCREDVDGVNMTGNRKRKSEFLSSKHNFSENYPLILNHTNSPNNNEYDSSVSSDLENEGPSGRATKMLAENELHQETTNVHHMLSLHKQENRSCNERNAFSLKDKLNHGVSLGSSTEVSLHVEKEDAFSPKEAYSVCVLNGLLMNTQKSKKISEIEKTEVTVRNTRLGSKGKHRENNAYHLYESYSVLPDLPCHETSDIVTSECLEPTVCLKRQADIVLSTSEEGSSHTSEIQEASSTTKMDKKNLAFENIEARKFNKDNKGIPLPVLEEKPLISFSSFNEVQEDKLPHMFMKIEHNGQLKSSGNHASVGSFCNPLYKSREIQNQCPSSKESFVTAYHGNVQMPSCVQDSIEEVFSTIDGSCPSPEKNHKIGKSIKSDDQKGSGLKRSRGFYVNDDDLLIAAIIKKKDFGSSCKKFPSKSEYSQPEAVRKLKGQKRGCRLQPRGPGNGGKLSADVNQFVIGARTVLGWLIDTGAVSLRDVVQFRNPKNHEVIKDGWVTRDGILCKCCTQIFSVSDFKAHAGFRQQKPPLNLYLQSGKSFTLCQLQAWSAEYKSRKGYLKAMNVVEVDQNDDTCGICADGGELICCDNCPSTYHQSCLSAQELPEGSWYCSNCICKICNKLACKKEDSSFLAVFECSQCKHKYHGACIIEKVAHNRDVGSSTWFCGENCKKIFLGLRSRVGMFNLIDDGLSWTILHCNHDDQNVYSPQKIALMAECNSKLAIAMSLMEECFLPMVDPRTGIDMVPHVLYNWGSTFARLNFEGFYTVILEKGDTLISVASVRVHGVKVAEMPLIATCGLHRRKKMCRRLMNSIEMMLRSFKVEMIVLSAIPSLVETWISGFGFSVITAEEKKQLHDVNLMLFPGSVMLQKKLCEASFLETGGNDQLHSAQEETQALLSFDSKKYADEEQHSAKDNELETDVECILSTSINPEQQGHTSPPRSILTPF